MKIIQTSLLISLVPLLTPMTAFAETEKQVVPVAAVPATQISSTSWRASQVIGVNVTNTANETAGKVEDLVLDMKTGKVLAVIISSGTYLGTADMLSSVPVTALEYDGTAKVFKTRLTKEQLGKAPQFKTDAWPDYNQATTMETLRSFRDSIGGDVTAPDNTAQNEKEVQNDAMNPTDQGNSAKDIQITKEIRLGIMDSDLSFNAKNIKIITRNEYVSLKGVVKSHEEHQAILKIAKNYANAANITDDLKVKSN